MGNEKRLEDFDYITPENEKFFCKKILFYKFKKDHLRWHICMLEMTETDGFLSFCAQRSWAEVDTQNVKRLMEIMDKERSAFCEVCARELQIAKETLIMKGFLPVGAL
jgi:hypothetical protein